LSRHGKPLNKRNRTNRFRLCIIGADPQPLPDMTDPTPQFAEIFNGADLPAAVISAKTGAELLDVSERQWHRLVQRGLLPKPIRLGRNTRWKLAEVEAALEAIPPSEA
jgi:predicted DNA-binding transcriptional regulator AlpA